MKTCCICGCRLEGYGNNPDGACWKNHLGEIEFPDFNEEERCCDDCNSRYVIPGRIYRLQLQKQAEIKES